MFVFGRSMCYKRKAVSQKCRSQSGLKGKSQEYGDVSYRETPRSISNLAVKPINADDSECENRKSPDRKEAFFSEKSEGSASFFVP